MNTNDGARIAQNLYHLEINGQAGVPITYAKPEDAIDDARLTLKRNRGALIRLLGTDRDYVFRDGAFVPVSKLDHRVLTMLRRILGSNADGHLSIDECMVIRAAMDELSTGRERIRAVFSRKEFATVLAALSYWESELDSGDFETNGPHFQHIEPLTADEVRALYDRISADTEHHNGADNMANDKADDKALTARELLTATQGYYIYDSRADQWLQDDERTWGRFDAEPAQFTEWEHARNIAKRERPDMNAILILAWIETETGLESTSTR